MADMAKKGKPYNEIRSLLGIKFLKKLMQKGGKTQIGRLPMIVPFDLIELVDLNPGRGPVYSQDWSVDDRFLATADTNQIRITNPGQGDEICLLEGHQDFIWGLAFSADSRQLASVSLDGTLRIWNMNTCKEAAVMACGSAFSVVWSADNSQILVGTSSGEFQIWDSREYILLTSRKEQPSVSLISLAYTGNGNLAAIGASNGNVGVFHPHAGAEMWHVDGSRYQWGTINGLDFSPDGKLLASAHQDGQVRIWNGINGDMIQAIQAHQGWVRGLAWSPDGSWLATGGQDKQVAVWNAKNGNLYARQQHNYLPVWSISWSPDGKRLASGAGGYNQAHTGATIIWQLP